ncbi:serine/threonine-protein kinase/endoribonuclease ire-1-like [Daphnia carinata]|uniref:serine/threonine-protein kinase/endoribonuclease ire-1-like n=1 Tax=Daphnia carinata TaxID=120202 RepID=UPI00257A79BB|nr:serine/threonine-protein kinase/endoribonuclease ire-1-like [Daphnia carinata]
MSTTAGDEASIASSPKLLGKGAFGIVYEGSWNGEKVAIKRIDKTEFLVLNESVDSSSGGQQREEENMKKLDHPNVLKLLHLEVDDNFKYFYLEFCEATIGDYNKGKYTGRMPPSEADSLHQMAIGLSYIHAMGQVHRDIKEDNVLIHKSSILKISDFGFSKPTTASGSYSLKSGIKGTRNYLSPELLKLAEEQASFGILAHQKSNISSDVFALGCVFYSYLTKGKHPFADPKGSFFIPANVLEGKSKLELITDPLFQSIVGGMIAFNPASRWSLDAVELQLKLRLKQTVN